ncbi:MAG: ABC transporter ATP-binding protein [Hyphomicrobiales bacterium]|nr:ABC transporter ATP-binding protein [Hyphomicrobiales bacterium]
MAGVAFEDVRKSFGTFVALQSFDLKVEDGEFMSLLGPSGCGKTTALRMLAGLEQPTAGTIRIGDRVVNGVPPAKRDIAMVFQSYALYPHMTVAQNIAYPLRKRGVPRAERPPKVKRAAELLQLEELLGRKPRQLSGGQQQRVALGRALVREPQVFLLDEPLSNLDAKLRAHMRAELIELHQRIGGTMVYVTHDQLEAMTMSTRIAVMNGGILQQVATPSEIYHRPKNLFVAGFIGTPAMTLIEGDMVTEGGETQVRAGGLRLRLADGHCARMPSDGTGISLGVRPEDITIGAGDQNGKIRVVEPTGHESIVMIECEDAMLTARIAGDIRLGFGEAVSFDLRADRVHVFDRGTGERLNADREDVGAVRVSAVAGGVE